MLSKKSGLSLNLLFFSFVVILCEQIQDIVLTFALREIKLDFDLEDQLPFQVMSLGKWSKLAASRCYLSFM